MSACFRQVRMALFVVLSAVLVVSSVPFAASAQQAGSHTSATNGRTVAWSSDWELDTADLNNDLGIERVMIGAQDADAVINFIFIADIVNREEVRDALLNSLKSDASSYDVIDSGDYDNLSYELSVFKQGDLTVGSFILVFTGQGTTATHIIAPIDGFADAVALAQGTVTLDGASTFNGIDGTSLQAQLEIAAASSSNTNATGQQPNTSTSSSLSTGSTSSGTTYTSPTWGYNVNYPAGWNTDPALNIGELDLASSGLNAIVSFQGIENPGLDGATLELVLYDTFADSVGGTSNVITSVSDRFGVVFVGASDGMIMIQELVILSPSVVIMVTAVIIDDYDSSLNQLQQISINGKKILYLL